MEYYQQNSAKGPRYFYVSRLKFFLMWLCTFSLYEIYWSYKNWTYIKERDERNISPVWRSVFAPFWYYSLFSDLAKHSSSEAHKLNVGVRIALVAPVSECIEAANRIKHFINTLD